MDLIEAILSDQAAALIGNLINKGRDMAAKKAKAKLAQYSAILDDVTCPLCEELDGQIFTVGSPEYYEFMPRVHHNCRCIWVYIEPEEVDQPDVDFERPLPELLKSHGSLMNHKFKPSDLDVDDIDEEIDRELAKLKKKNK